VRRKGAGKEFPGASIRISAAVALNFPVAMAALPASRASAAAPEVRAVRVVAAEEAEDFLGAVAVASPVAAGVAAVVVDVAAVDADNVADLTAPGSSEIAHAGNRAFMAALTLRLAIQL
jgi:hypothetical protein